ncbi:MAG: hypothetical protein ACLQBJ_14495 [Bryobacteraceae bacterium]
MLSRLLGGLLILFGAAITTVFVVVSITSFNESVFGRVRPVGPTLIAAGIGLVFVAAGVHYWRRRPGAARKEEPAPDTPQSAWIAAHRELMTALGAVGFVGSICYAGPMLQAGAARSAGILLAFTCGALALKWCARMAARPGGSGTQEWERVPKSLRALVRAIDVLSKIALVGFVAVILVLRISPFEGTGAMAFQFALALLLAVSYGWSALFFRYGELRGGGSGEGAAAVEATDSSKPVSGE